MLQRPSVHYPRLLFHELLERAADLHGESHAVLHGSSRVTFAGAAWQRDLPAARESGAFARARVELALALDTRGLEADGTALVDVRAGYSRGTVAWAVDLSLDSLIEDLDAKNDVEAGPRCTFVLDGRRTFSLFAHALRSRHPLGLRASGVLVGFEASEGSIPRVDGRP